MIESWPNFKWKFVKDPQSRQNGHRYPPKQSKVSYDHFDGWLETCNHPLFAAWYTLWPKLLLTNGNKAYILSTSPWGLITSIRWSAADQRRRGEDYLLPAAQQSGHSSHLNVSRGTCDLCQDWGSFENFHRKWSQGNLLQPGMTRLSTLYRLHILQQKTQSTVIHEFPHCISQRLWFFQ